MDRQQMYNESAMLHDSFVAKANESNDQNEKQKYEQLATDQQSISDRLKSQDQVQTQNHQAQAQNQQSQAQNQQAQAQNQQSQRPDSPQQPQ